MLKAGCSESALMNAKIYSGPFEEAAEILESRLPSNIDFILWGRSSAELLGTQFQRPATC